MGNLVARLRLWWQCRKWTPERQLAHLRHLVHEDYRWLAHDKTAEALGERYLDALAPDWYLRPHEHTSDFRQRIGLEPVRKGPTP